jgi:hypothetical protein
MNNREATTYKFSRGDENNPLMYNFLAFFKNQAKILVLSVKSPLEI